MLWLRTRLLGVCQSLDRTMNEPFKKYFSSFANKESKLCLVVRNYFAPECFKIVQNTHVIIEWHTVCVLESISGSLGSKLPLQVVILLLAL